MNSTLLIAFALGMRHGVDPDHLTAIDGLSRIRPRATNGLYFAVGHGFFVTLLTVGVGEMIATRISFLGPWVLMLIGAVNLWKLIRPTQACANVGRPIVSQPFLLGMLLAAGFETASQFAAMILSSRLNPWIVGAAFTCGMVIVDGLDGYLAASTQRLAVVGDRSAVLASRALAILVVVFSFGIGIANLMGVEMDQITFPLGVALFAAVIAIRVWSRMGQGIRVRPVAVTSVIVAAATTGCIGGARPGNEMPPSTLHSHAAHSAPPTKADGASDFATAMMQVMEKMDHDMMAAPMTGDPDHDFAAMMIPHHQGAADMAKPYLLYGKDPVLRRLASEIIVTQGQEIEVMRTRLAALESAAGKASPLMAPQAGIIAPATQALSSRDRVYTADQTSNTVSVIDPSTNTLLGVIRLGDPVPGALSPLYRGQLLVHGLGFSPDHRTLAVVSIGSNSVTFIDTVTNTIKGVVYIGRSPHEAFFTPDGAELWVTVRGEDYLSVIDPVQMKETRRVQTANGPGMVLFRSDGKYAFVPSSFTPELDVVDTKTYAVVARVPQVSPFSPNLAVSRDGTQVWFTLKDSGKVQIMSAQSPFHILATLETGPITNHVALVDNEKGRFAYVTVGAENKVKVYARDEGHALIAEIPTGDLPHGIWASGDGTRVYVGLENQDAVIGIDTRINAIIATIPIGQQPQALVYVPDAVPVGDGAANLVSLGDAGKAEHLKLIAPDGGPARATVSVNAIGPLDLLQAAVSGLQPGESYTLWIAASRSEPSKDRTQLVTFKTNASGAQIAQAIAPLRQVLTTSKTNATTQPSTRFLFVTGASGDVVFLTQSE